jgi:hypothetical protein
MTTGAHLEYVILTASPRQQWLRQRASMCRLYVHCLCFALPLTDVHLSRFATPLILPGVHMIMFARC